MKVRVFMCGLERWPYETEVTGTENLEGGRGLLHGTGVLPLKMLGLHTRLPSPKSRSNTRTMLTNVTPPPGIGRLLGDQNSPICFNRKTHQQNTTTTRNQTQTCNQTAFK